jgi:GntR family transcriptional regulator / MocR family aminotransferase
MLLISLDAPGVPLHRQLYQGLRERILDGRLRPGERLPSTRTLANQLSVGRNTVLEAFEMLLAEGYLDARTGSGTYVTSSLPDAEPDRPPGASRLTERLAPPLRLSAWAKRALEGPLPESAPPSGGRPMTLLRNGLLPPAPFPWAAWERLARQRLAHPDPRLYQYGEPTGLLELRQAIADYVSRARGVRAEADQVMVTSGSQGVLDLVSRVLLDPGDIVALEDPSYLGARRAFAASGARLAGVAVDEHGLDPDRLPPRARLAYLTPSHQFPTGAVLPVGRRLAVLDWAARVGAWVLEDDYDSEFRYGGRPLAALQGLAPERVIYCGTFSKALYPGFRLGFLVAPRELVATLREVRYVIDRQPPSLEQLILTDLLREGHFERHLRRMRLVYAEKRAALLAALRQDLPTWRWRDSGAGLHVYVCLPEGCVESAVVARAARVGVGLYGASQYYLEPRCAPPSLVLGYAHLETGAIRAAVRRVAGRP